MQKKENGFAVQVGGGHSMVAEGGAGERSTCDKFCSRV